MLKKIFLSLLIACSLHFSGFSQYEFYRHQGEYGIGIGANQYFGDLNPKNQFKQQNLAIQAFYLYNFNNYFGIKAAISYLRMGYSDELNDGIYKLRNLSFNSNNWEYSLSGHFNFYSFLPGIEGHKFTPYLSAGIGLLNYNPYALVKNNTGGSDKIYLRPLGTEGQNSTLAHDGKKYGSTAIVFPLTFGVKYAVSENINLFAELGYRLTTTDYLDDVSTTYAGTSAFEAPYYNGNATEQWYAQQLQDMSQTLHKSGEQRGKSLSKDTYLVGQIGISFNINGYNCPKTK